MRHTKKQLEAMLVADLKAVCRAMGIPCSGKRKAELVKAVLAKQKSVRKGGGGGMIDFNVCLKPDALQSSLAYEVKLDEVLKGDDAKAILKAAREEAECLNKLEAANAEDAAKKAEDAAKKAEEAAKEAVKVAAAKAFAMDIVRSRKQINTTTHDLNACYQFSFDASGNISIK